MSDNVINFPSAVPFTIEENVEIPIDTSKVIEGALMANLKDVVIVGHDQNGDVYLASSSNNLPNVLWLLEIARFNVVANGPD